MNARELADRFTAKIAAAGVEKARQKLVADENNAKRLDDVEHCKSAMTTNVMPFLSELKSFLPEEQFSFAPQVDRQDHKVVGVSFTIGDGRPTTISTAFGNVLVTHAGASGSSKGVSFCFSPRCRAVHFQFRRSYEREDSQAGRNGYRQCLVDRIQHLDPHRTATSRG